MKNILERKQKYVEIIFDKEKGLRTSISKRTKEVFEQSENTDIFVKQKKQNYCQKINNKN